MLFKKVALIPYGTYNGKDRVFKIFFKGVNNDLFLQGYYISGQSPKVIISPKLNELYDYSVINTNDGSKNFITDKNGAFKITLVNDSVPGYAKILDVVVSVDIIEYANTSNQDSSNEIAYDIIKSKLAPLNKVNAALAEYIALISYIDYVSEKESKESQLPNPEEFPELSIIKYYKTTPFMSLLSDV